MIEEFERDDYTARVSRLVALPKTTLDAILVGRNISLEDFEEVKSAVLGIGAVVTAEEAILRTFERTEISAQRYNTTSFPVFYSAVARETCIAEISYHLGDAIKQSGPRYYQFLDVTFSGSALHLCGHQARYPDLVSPTSAGYPFCQKLASEARLNGVEGLCAPSARHVSGTCIPIFVRNSISSPSINGSIQFHWDGSAISHAIL